MQHLAGPSEHVSRRLEVVPLARPVVELPCNLAALGLADPSQAKALGQILAHQSVEVLIRPAFPRVVGHSKVAGHTKLPLECFVVVKLGAVVEGDGPELAAQASHDLAGSLGCFGHRPGFELANQGEAAAALDHSQQAVRRAGADERIGFPIANTASRLDNCRAFADVTFAQQYAASRTAAVTFAAHLRQDSSESPQASAIAFVASQTAVDGFVAGNELALGSEQSDDLFGTPALSNRCINLIENLMAELRATT